MEAFTQHYRSRTELLGTHLPYWDLCAALRPAGRLAGWGLDKDTKQLMREMHRFFTMQALNRLSVR
jgi:hypothetical protein